MAGEIVKKGDYDVASDAVDNSRGKWGLSKPNTTVGVGENTTASKLNRLIDLLTEAKNKCGYSGSMPAKVNTSDYLLKNKFNEISSTSTKIYNWCRCNGNCSGSCTNKCSGCGGRCGSGSGCCSSCSSQPGH